MVGVELFEDMMKATYIASIAADIRVRCAEHSVFLEGKQPLECGRVSTVDCWWQDKQRGHSRSDALRPPRQAKN